VTGWPKIQSKEEFAPMWMRLNKPDVAKEVAKEVDPSESRALSHLIKELSYRSWAKEVSAVISLQKLRLTSAASWKQENTAGAVFLSVDSKGRVAAEYCPAKSNITTARVKRRPEDAPDAVELLVWHMLSDDDHLANVDEETDPV
jgi:hypothetical protein